MENLKVKYGVYMGVMAIVISMICYFMGHDFYLMWHRAIIFLVAIYFLYKATTTQRYNEEGHLSFGEAFSTSFVVFVLGNFILSVFTYILMNYIDAGLIDSMNEMPAKMAAKVAGIMGEEIPQEDLEQMQSLDLGYGVGMALWNFVSSLFVPGAIFSLIIAAVTKRG